MNNEELVKDVEQRIKRVFVLSLSCVEAMFKDTEGFKEKHSLIRKMILKIGNDEIREFKRLTEGSNAVKSNRSD